MASGGLFGGGREKKRFLFIICVNNDEIFSECQFYIDKLKVPPGYSKSVRVIRDARGMCQAYNSAMTEEPAKYRIYMHQDVSILNPYFLYDILEIFESDKKIGMIGMVGSKKLPPDAVVWHGERVGNLYSLDPDNVDFKNYRYSVDEGVTDVEAVEGFLMATDEDLPWREDLFDGWDYYNLSQSAEFRKAGYRVVVPVQRKPWCAHDESVNNRWDFNAYRKKFMTEYGYGK